MADTHPPDIAELLRLIADQEAEPDLSRLAYRDQQDIIADPNHAVRTELQERDRRIRTVLDQLGLSRSDLVGLLTEPGRDLAPATSDEPGGKPRQKDADMSKPTIPTKHELLAMIANRRRDLQRQTHDLTPPWAQDRDDPSWQRIRERERKIVRVTNRLEKAKQKLDHDFDMNS